MMQPDFVKKSGCFFAFFLNPEKHGVADCVSVFCEKMLK